MREYLIPEIKAFVFSFFGIHIEEFYYDWGFHNYTGVLAWKETGESGECVEPMNGNDWYPGKEQLHEEITRMRQLSPSEEMHSCIINNRTLLMVRKGSLTEIEKEFLRLGYENVLKTAKRSLEKKFLLHNANIGAIMNQTVSDVYIDWNFQLDKSVWIFILQADKP